MTWLETEPLRCSNQNTASIAVALVHHELLAERQIQPPYLAVVVEQQLNRHDAKNDVVGHISLRAAARELSAQAENDGATPN
eukprot:CAMPEP_0115130814 /NCGR_PEP_ID=MMETSP0227-20121206/52703_1 /TAXON_ID=89957 /ORGANISM="Polarella glacialis, Strain CCMP 1383" /LENGTH=81 /DNA_ID=CAMNT_0002536131 /DNA_START=338 /DNA_END=580 /DNA_ORIENTATION=+